MKVSVITPSIRPNGLETVRKSLFAQDFKDWEWIVCSPFEYYKGNRWIEDRKKDSGDVWGHTKACNDLCNWAEGELIVTVWDNEWIYLNTLSHLVKRYEEIGSGAIFLAGRSYPNDKFLEEDWHDPRLDNNKDKFALCNVSDADTCLCIFPKQAFIDVGGFDEGFDKVGALADQEFFLRVNKAGYPLYLDTTLEYKQIRHEPPLSADSWEKAKEYYKYCEEEVKSGRRFKLNFAR